MQLFQRPVGILDEPVGQPVQQFRVRWRRAAFAEITGPAFIDVPDHQRCLAEQLRIADFTVQRPYRRMFKDAKEGFGDIARMFALAGPELG